MIKFTQEQILQITSLYKNGSTTKELSEKFKCWPYNISKLLKNLGLKPKNHSQSKWVNSSYFNIIDTEEKAYLLGFFVADGCIRVEKARSINNSVRLCFSNSIEDEEIINLIHKRICPNNKMLKIHNTSGAKNRKEQLLLQWTSYEMSEVLIKKYKILPNKTLDYNFEFPFETIPKKLWRDFIRGFMDGDGYISSNELRFVFNSPKFMNQIIEIFKSLFDEYQDSVLPFKYTVTEVLGKTCKYWRLFIPIGRGRNKILTSFLYENTTIFLHRKYNKTFKIK